VASVYQELRRLASSYLRSERPGHTLGATGLVHEAYMRLAGAGVDYQNRSHFFAVAATAMRRILVDHARHHHRQRRGGGALRETLNEALMRIDEAEYQMRGIGKHVTSRRTVDVVKDDPDRARPCGRLGLSDTR
jgi:RNA polymerase sigma factor (TIGR02999 family)